MKHLKLSILIVLTLIFLQFPDGWYYCSCSADEEAEAPRRKADRFIEEGPEFVGETVVHSKTDVIGRLGKPAKMKSEKVQNPHDDVMDTVYHLFYKGLYLEIYELNLYDRCYVFHIVLESKDYKTKWNLGIGSTRDRIKAVLGDPDERDNISWTYVASDGYPSTVKFYFSQQRVHKVEWRYVID